MSIARVLVIGIGPIIAGALAAVGLAWLLVTVHALSPDNVVAGAAIGFGGAVAGSVAGLLGLIRAEEI